MSVIGNAITLGGGSGGGAEKLMNQGQVSTTSDYATAHFDASVDFSKYAFVYVQLYRGGAVTGSNVVATPSTSANFTIIGDRTYSMVLDVQNKSIKCTNYSGAFVNLYVDVYGYQLP